MFERFIYILMQTVRVVLNEFERAYYETFGDRATQEGKELSYYFYGEVKRRRKINKEFFIRNAAIWLGKETLKHEGYLLPPEQAIAKGEEMFIDAQMKGKIDCLNNVINEE